MLPPRHQTACGGDRHDAEERPQDAVGLVADQQDRPPTDKRSPKPGSSGVSPMLVCPSFEPPGAQTVSSPATLSRAKDRGT